MSIKPEKSEDIIHKDEEPFGLGCALEYFAEVDEVMKMIDNLKTVVFDQTSINERAYERFTFILGQYQEQPHLLDSHIDQLLDKFITLIRDRSISDKAKHAVFKYMFVVIKVRGYKVIVRHLPHEVSDFEPVLQLLELQDKEDSETWSTRYVLLLWLSIIVMIPFHMSRLDGFNSSSDDSQKPIMSRVMNVCKQYALVPDKCRDAAAYLAARFLTRYDVKEQHLSSFFEWACKLSIASDSIVFVKYGCLASVAMVLKHGKREDLIHHAPYLLKWIINAEFKVNPGTNIQKLVYKNIQRIGLIFLPARIATWRYQRGSRSLMANLHAGDYRSGTFSTSLPCDECEENINVPDEVEEVVDQLFQGLGSSDCVVRWSAAKGIGRVTGRLPKELADEVVGSVLELFNPRESDGTWHGACLALAELGRRGLILPQRLPEVVPVILKALDYDEPRGYSSVGSHIRDSACYVCWSFARAYEMEVLRPFVKDIAAALLVVTCFDREINCRRAASAAFQENVGRQGTFPHGIDILTTADFFEVSIRNNAYLHISVYIAQFVEYTVPLIKHLVDRKVEHWDIAIRELTAKALHNLTPRAHDYMVQTVLGNLFKKTESIDLNRRHGAVLAIGEIIYALSKLAEEQNLKLETLLGPDLIESAQNLIPNFQERFYFRGLGGELMRHACCDFINKCSLAHMPFHGHCVIDEWLKLLNECLTYDVTNIRMGAVDALPAFLNEYYVAKSQQDQSVVIKNYIDSLSSSVQVIRMGHALALGAMPSFILLPHLQIIVDALVTATHITPDTLKWAESRRDAIKGLTSICVTMEDCMQKEFLEEYLNKCYTTFLSGLSEYTQDNRGDIGAWVREASVSALHTLTLLLAKHKPDVLTSELVPKIMSGVAQQAVEKIDRTRALAGKIFYSFIHSKPDVPNIPSKSTLLSLFPEDECELLNWNSAAITFPKFVKLIELPAYTYNMLLGFVCSVGGLTETLVKNSSTCLFEFFQLEENQKGLSQIVHYCDAIYQIFFDYQRNDRISIPMFRFLSKIMGSGCITNVITDANSEFPQKILKLIQLELAGCKNIYKLIDGIDLLCQFIQIKSKVCSTALVQLSILLCHRQSYVRKATSGRLYESLIVYGESSTIPEENLDEAMNLLSSTNWEESVEAVKPIRNTLCNLMSINVPVPKRKA
ncbi:hypothetical protein PPYR_04365 [Photinus pyralis]|uniref:Tubulin-specific chaperone D n=1 Tax=Photinus pyralis TaxID=7054 RepID=A0A1Y1MM56_PHOPY|nr:tubulin-specific chaperone D [Photinus pyralis]KAB0802179.1 hypothetical protein PPYR_04365 [Photinus pyralis]